MVIDDHRVDVAVVSQAIHQYCEFWIDALQTGGSLTPIQRRDNRVDAGQNETVRTANRNSVGAAGRDAADAPNSHRLRGDENKASVRAARCNSIGPIDYERVVRATRGNAVRVIDRASVGAAGSNAVGAS